MASSNHFIVSEMPLRFYDVPEDAPALFSTRNCALPKRQLIEPYPPTVARSDLQTDVRNKASLLRQEFPSIIQIVRTPTNWTDLYFFFDGVDIWAEGAAYLYYVLEYIGTQNKTIEIEIAQDCKKEITNWAINWVNYNKDLVATVPSSKDLVSTFNTADWNEVKDLRAYEFIWLRTALDFHRNLVVEALKSQSLEARPRSTPAQGMQPHTVVAHTYAKTEQGNAMAQISHVKIGQGVLVADHTESSRGRTVPVLPIRRLPQTYDQFMEDQRYLAATNSDQHGDFVNFRNDENNGDGLTRLRSWSNDSTRNLRGPHREPVRHANISSYRPKHYPRPIFERDSVGNTPRASPQRHTPQKSRSTCHGPIYVHNSQQVSPSSDRDHHRVSSDTDQGMTQCSKRNCVNHVSRWTGRSNDARLLASLEVQRGGQGLQDSSTTQQPFESHPRVQSLGNSTTFFYTGVPRLPSADDFQRTLYVAGVDQEIFTSHELKAMMSECGTVESVRYLYPNFRPGGPSFVTFTEESALPRAIRRFNGHVMQSGRVLAVDFPRKSSRHRSGSQLSQKSFSPHERPPFTARREFEPRSNTRQAIVNKHQVWNRELNYQGHLYRHPQPSTNSSTAQISLETPLTVGFESQLMSTSQPSMMAEPVHRHMQTVAAEVVLSSISEVVQHESALNRFCEQMPLEPRERSTNIPNMNKKSNAQMRSSSKHNAITKEPEEKPSLNVATKQEEAQLLSRSRKENVPMRISSNVGVISATPRKKTCNIVASDCVRIAGSGKQKKKAAKQNISKSQGQTASPTKARSERLLSDISIKRENHYNGTQEADSKVMNKHAQASGCLTNCEAKPQTNSNPAAASPASSIQLDSLDLSEKAFDLELRKELTTKATANNKRKKALSKSDSSNESSFKDTALCPDVVLADSFSTVNTDSTEYLTSRSTSTSFSDDSDRKPSLHSGRSDTSISARGIIKISNTLTSIYGNDEQDGSRLVTQTSVKRSTETDKGNSTSSNLLGHKLFSAKPREKERQQRHLKRESNTSMTSDRPGRAVDSKLLMESRKNGDVKDTAGVTRSSNVSGERSRTEVEENRELSAIGILADLAQWPALGPVKSPQSSIADGKHPIIPLQLPRKGRGSSSGNIKSLDTPILPAVPLIRPRRLSIDSMGRVPWPFVKKFSEK